MAKHPPKSPGPSSSSPPEAAPPQAGKEQPVASPTHAAAMKRPAEEPPKQSRPVVHKADQGLWWVHHPGEPTIEVKAKDEEEAVQRYMELLGIRSSPFEFEVEYKGPVLSDSSGQGES